MARFICVHKQKNQQIKWQIVQLVHRLSAHFVTVTECSNISQRKHFKISNNISLELTTMYRFVYLCFDFGVVIACLLLKNVFLFFFLSKMLIIFEFIEVTMCEEWRKIANKYSDIPIAFGSDVYFDWTLRNVWLASFLNFLIKPRDICFTCDRVIQHNFYNDPMGWSIGIWNPTTIIIRIRMWCRILLLLLMLLLLNIAYQTNHSFMCYWLDTNSNRRHTYVYVMFECLNAIYRFKVLKTVLDEYHKSNSMQCILFYYCFCYCYYCALLYCFVPLLSLMLSSAHNSQLYFSVC